MGKVFPQVRLNGKTAEEKTKAARYIRRGMQELFSVQEMRRTSGRPILQRSVQIDENCTILVQIVKGQEFVDIFYTSHPVLVEEKEEPIPFENPERCPPAFVLYMRKDFPGGTDDKDYLIAYNEISGSWVLATTDPYISTSNTGFWPEHNPGEHHESCDLVLWDGQPGGVGACGMWGAGEEINGGYDTEQRVRYNWGNNGFYIAGMRIEFYLGIIAAGVFTDSKNNTNYYAIRENNTKLQLMKGSMPPPNAAGVISPVWETTHEYLYADYADNPTFDEYWGPPSGNAFVNQEGVAYFGIPIEKDVVVDGVTRHVFPMCLVKVDMLSGEMEILRDNLDRMPVNTQNGYSDEGGNASCGRHSSEFYTFGSCSDVAETPPAYNPETEYVNSGGSAAYTNKERPLLLRTFGGLDRLYTYELEIDWSINGSYSAQVSGWSFVKGLCANPSCIIDYGTDPYTIGEGPPRGWWYMHGNGSASRTEFEEGQAVVTVYDYGEGEEDKKEVASLVVLDIKASISMGHGFTNVVNALNEEAATASGLVSLGDGVQPSNSNPSGDGTVTLIRRQITGHHPQIDNSWSYIEVEESWNSAMGISQEKTIRIVEMGEVVKTVTSQLGASGHLGHPWFDYSVKEERVSTSDPYVTIPTYTTLRGLANGSRYGPASNIEQNPIFISFSQGNVPASQDYTILSQDFHGANRYYYQGSSALQPKPINIGFGGMYAENSECNMRAGMGNYETDIMFIDNLYGGGVWGHGVDFTFNGTGLGSVAVHRPFGRDDKRPFISIHKKIHIDERVRVATGAHKDDLHRAGQIRGIVISAPASPNDYEEGGGDWLNDVSRTLGYYTDYCMMWTKAIDKNDEEAWKDRADEGEWTVYSNVLSEDLIKTLTKELSLDIIGIGII